MPERVTVRLSVEGAHNPQDLHQTDYIDRFYTLNASSDKVRIGRSSSTNGSRTKPAADNGVFHSRVVSRNHAELSTKPDQTSLWVKDLGSTHGTFVNGIPVDAHVPRLLQNGDILALGQSINHETKGLHVARKYKLTITWGYERNQSVELVSTQRRSQRTSFSTNLLSLGSFTVPDGSSEEDEEDDEVEVISSSDTSFISSRPQSAVKPATTNASSSKSIPLDFDSDDEDIQVMGVTPTKAKKRTAITLRDLFNDDDDEEKLKPTHTPVQSTQAPKIVIDMTSETPLDEFAGFGDASNGLTGPLTQLDRVRSRVPSQETQGDIPNDLGATDISGENLIVEVDDVDDYMEDEFESDDDAQLEVDEEPQLSSQRSFSPVQAPMDSPSKPDALEMAALAQDAQLDRMLGESIARRRAMLYGQLDHPAHPARTFPFGAPAYPAWREGGKNLNPTYPISEPYNYPGPSVWSSHSSEYAPLNTSFQSDTTMRPAFGPSRIFTPIMKDRAKNFQTSLHELKGKRRALALDETEQGTSIQPAVGMAEGSWSSQVVAPTPLSKISIANIVDPVLMTASPQLEVHFDESKAVAEKEEPSHAEIDPKPSKMVVLNIPTKNNTTTISSNKRKADDISDELGSNVIMNSSTDLAPVQKSQRVCTEATLKDLSRSSEASTITIDKSRSADSIVTSVKPFLLGAVIGGISMFGALCSLPDLK